MFINTVYHNGAMKFRVDKDSLGEVKIPSGAYYGAFTARALKHYKATGLKSHKNLIKAYVMIKRLSLIHI